MFYGCIFEKLFIDLPYQSIKLIKMACVKKENTGHCSHFQCPFSEQMDLECVDVMFLDDAGFCEIGLNCIAECPYSYGYEMEAKAQKAFGVPEPLIDEP